MPRKKRNWTPKQGNWSQEAMQQAVKAVKENEMGVRKAALTYTVPKSTLQRRVQKGIMDMPASRPPVFKNDEEELLLAHIFHMESMGFGLTIDDVCRVTFEMAHEAGITNNFNKEKKRAGYDWYVGFRERHPTLSLRKPEGLSAARAAMLNPTVIQDHFKRLNELLTSTDLKNKPAQIFNADETGFSLVHTPSRILAKKGKRTVQARTSGERGENVTALICANAAGKALPPFVIFKGKRLSPAITLHAPPDTLFGVSDSSFIDAELFEIWFSKLFLNNLPPARPVLLVLDGHGSHLTLSTLKLAKANSIHMYCLPPHTTNHTQPLDKSVFKSMKSSYNKKCEKFMRDNPGKIITRYDFCSIFRDVYLCELSMSNIVSGFKGTGIYPFNPQAIKGEHLQQSSIATKFHKDCDTVDTAEAAEQHTIELPTPAEVIEPELTPTSGNKPVELNDSNVIDLSPTSITATEPSLTVTVDSTTKSPSVVTTPTNSVTTEQSKDQPTCSKFAFSLKRPIVEKNIQQTGKKSRRVTHARCMTSDEIIEGIERKKREVEQLNVEKELRKQERERKKIERERQKQEREANKLLKQKSKGKGTTAKKSTSRPRKKQTEISEIPTEASENPTQASENTTEASENHTEASENRTDASDNPEDNPQNYCGYCNGFYYDDDSDDDDWWQCRGPCKLYFHESCTGLWKLSQLEMFKCSNCKACV